MRLSDPRPISRARLLGILAILFVFVAIGAFHYESGDGDDLASSYVGCRLISGNPGHLYAHDPVNFAAIGPDTPWQAQADAGRYVAFLHPYVQTPLWAYSLQPLCTHTHFQAFERIFAVLTMLSFAVCIGVVAFYWAPELFKPNAIALIVLCLWFSEPFRYAMSLMQTHVLFLLLTLSALILAERKRPVSAGLLLACAAAVKITPGALILYWLLTRRWKAALSTVAWSALLAILTLVTAGKPLFTAYLADLHRLSRILLVSQNNQSFAAWFLTRMHPAQEIFRFTILSLPDAVRLASMALLIVCTFVGGLIDRPRFHADSEQTGNAHDRRNPQPGEPPLPGSPLGAMFALVASTLFAPIAWTHYSIILLAPLMLLIRELILLRRANAPHLWWFAALILLVAALNFQPLARDLQSGIVGRYSLLRSHFYSEVLCLTTLAAAAWIRRSSSCATRPVTHSESEAVASVI